MPPSGSFRVFISYARKDGAVLAQRLQSDLTKQGFDAWLDTQRLRGGVTWTREIETALDQSNYVLVLLTHASYVSEICRSEQLRALRKGTCVIPVKAQSDTDIPLHLEAKNYRDFSDPSQYDHSVARVVGHVIKRIAGNLQYISGFLLVVHPAPDSFDQLRTRIRDFPLSGLQHLIHQLPSADAVV